MSRQDRREQRQQKTTKPMKQKDLISTMGNHQLPIVAAGVGRISPTSPWISGNPNDWETVFDAEALIDKIMQKVPYMPNVGDVTAPFITIALDNIGHGSIQLDHTAFPIGSLALSPKGIVRDLLLGFLYETVSSNPADNVEFSLEYLDAISDNLHTNDAEHGAPLVYATPPWPVLPDNFLPAVKVQCSPDIPMSATNATTFPTAGVFSLHTQDNRTQIYPDFAAGVIESVRDQAAGSLLPTIFCNVAVSGSAGGRVNLLPVFVSDAAALMKLIAVYKYGWKKAKDLFGLSEPQSLVTSPISTNGLLEYSQVLGKGIREEDVDNIISNLMTSVADFGARLRGVIS